MLREAQHILLSVALSLLKNALQAMMCMHSNMHDPSHVKVFKRNLLLQDAQNIGCLTVSGLEMFIGQAAQQFKLFTGKDAPVDQMREAVLASISKS